MPNMSRRNALKGMSAAAASAATLSAASYLRAADANNKVRVAVLGVGGRGGGHLSAYRALEPDGVEVAYICDPDESRRAKALMAFPKAQGVADLRKVLDDKTIDAVSIATPDHWHAPAAILACAAGKHVYVEKPCCHNYREGQLLVQAARKYDRVVQHGTQQRSTPATANVIQMLREGVIGKVLVAKAWNVQRRANIGHEQPSDPPAGVDYDLWVGPAEMVPFQKNRFHYSWHWWYNFGTGDLGNDGCHDLDYALWGLDINTLPNRVSALGGKYYFDDDQQYPDTQTAVIEYDGDGQVGNRKQLIFELRIWSTSYPFNTDSGVEFFGTHGRLFYSKRGKMELWDEANKRVPDPMPKEPAQLKATEHFADFIDAIRQERRPQADIEIGFRSIAACCLANTSTRLGRSLEFDPQKESIVGDDEANRMLKRQYRAGGHWAIPEGV